METSPIKESFSPKKKVRKIAKVNTIQEKENGRCADRTYMELIDETRQIMQKIQGDLTNLRDQVIDKKTSPSPRKLKLVKKKSAAKKN